LLDHSGVGVGVAHDLDCLLVRVSHVLLHATHLLAAQGVACEGETEVLGGPAQHVFHVGQDVVIEFVHAQV